MCATVPSPEVISRMFFFFFSSQLTSPTSCISRRCIIFILNARVIWHSLASVGLSPVVRTLRAVFMGASNCGRTRISLSALLLLHVVPPVTFRVSRRTNRPVPVIQDSASQGVRSAQHYLQTTRRICSTARAAHACRELPFRRSKSRTR